MNMFFLSLFAFFLLKGVSAAEIKVRSYQSSKPAGTRIPPAENIMRSNRMQMPVEKASRPPAIGAPRRTMTPTKGYLPSRDSASTEPLYVPTQGQKLETIVTK